MDTGDKSEVELLRQQLALERKRLEEERLQLELEKKKQEDEFKRLKEEFYRKQEMEEMKKKEVETLCQKLTQERQFLENERNQLLAKHQEDEYQQMQEQFKKKARLDPSQELRVPDPGIHSVHSTDVQMAEEGNCNGKAASPDTVQISPISKASNSTSPSRKPASTTPKGAFSKQDLICVVCGDNANGMHFKALTCEGCKVFFRRNSKKQGSLKCHSETEKGMCEMDLYMRRHCAYCRMKKCLEVGMEVGRVWDKERCKTRKQIKKMPATSSASVAAPTASYEDRGASGEMAPLCSSTSRPELTEEQQQLMDLADAALKEAMKIKTLPNGTSASLADIRKNSHARLNSSQQKDDEMVKSLFESMGNIMSKNMAGVSYVPTSYAPSNGQDIWLDSSDDSADDDDEEVPFDRAMFKHTMEVIVIILKELIAFVKVLPGFLELSCEDQAALVKESFLDFLVVKAAGFYKPEKKIFCIDLVSGENFRVNDIKMAGFTSYMNLHVPFCEKMAKLNLTTGEHAVLLAICLLTPDRHVLSDDAKLSISPHHEKLVETLCASGYINHPDEQQFFPKVVSLLTQLRDVTESFMDTMRRLKLEGQSIQPILEEILDV